MAFLLGNESCISSLRTDLTDIQETIDEILVRTGSVKCYSWKSPDKLASELKVKELIERYSFGNDEVENQVAHYSLLELIIDRLLLLVYISTNFVDQTNSSNEQTSLNNSKITRLSAGLAIKKFWNKFTQLCSSYRQLSCQNKSNGIKQKSSEESVKSSITEKSKLSNGKGSIKQIAEEVSSKSVQTNETAFVPCESCAKVQTNLKQNADQIINICHYHNITSQVGKFRTTLMANQLVGGWMNGSDIEKWLIEQDKDFGKIAKHLEFLSKNNELLKTKLSENEVQVEKMKTAEKELRKILKEEQDTKGITAKQYEKKLNDQKTELQNKINSLEAEIKNLSQIKQNLEEKNQSLKNLYENNEKIVVELTETNKVLTQEVNTKTDFRIKNEHLEEEKRLLNKELECLKRELNDKTYDLNSERTKLENLIRAEQSLKLKHEVTLESFDKITADYESLKKKYEYIEEEKKQIIDSVKYKETQIDSLKYESEILQNSINSLKLELKKMKDNETLLIKYPDLYGPLPQLNDEEINVVQDMQNQINANKHRIHLLDTLNKKLLNSIQKINKTQSRSGSSMNEVDLPENDQPNISTTSEQRNYFMKPPESSSRAQSTVSIKAPLNTRPVPLFKLENEIDQSEQEAKNKYWTQEDSFTNRSIASNKSDKAFLDNQEQSTNKTLKGSDDFTIELDNDEDFDFLKDKHQSDQNYLNKLNQISKGADLRIENSDLSISSKSSSRRGSQTSSNLYSASQSSVNSRASNHSSRYQIKTPTIPPADKTMEVIVGKGRRVSSASGSARANLSPAPGSATSNQANKKEITTSARSKPPAPSRGGFKCDNCSKKYDDIKNLDIHKMYCTK